MSQRISSGSPWESKVGYSRAVVKGGLIAVSATAGTGPDGKVVASGDAYKQARASLEKIGDALKQAGASFNDVLHSRVYVTDISHFDDVARAHGEIFGEIRPALSLLHVRSFVDPEMLVEIDVTAVKDA